MGRRSPLARGLILLTASALVIVLALGAFWIDGRAGLRPWPWLRWPGMAMLLGGVVLLGWAEATFLRVSRSTGGFADAPQVLVARGPYRFTRNPIYIGAFGVLLGLGLWRGSPTLLALALAFLPAMHLFVTRLEEPATCRRLGPAYEDYLRRVPRWLPHLRRGSGPKEGA